MRASAARKGDPASMSSTRAHPAHDDTAARAYAPDMPPESTYTSGPSFEALVRDLATDVWRLCRHLGDAGSAEDLTQETFLRVHSALPGFRGDASVRTWVFSIARRVCADHVRRQRKERALTEIATREQTLLTEPDSTNEVSLWDLVARLSPDRRAAFVLTQIFGLSYDEAARVCDCAIGTIRSRVSRARADLISAQAADGFHPRLRTGTRT
jgi:RNA polymerase sigma-70 factor, ECF subfamily